MEKVAKQGKKGKQKRKKKIKSRPGSRPQKNSGGNIRKKAASASFGRGEGGETERAYSFCWNQNEGTGGNVEEGAVSKKNKDKGRKHDKKQRLY